MKVRLIRQTKKLSGEVGQEVECESRLGNYLACHGFAVIVKHDPPTGPACVVKKSGKERIEEQDADD